MTSFGSMLRALRVTNGFPVAYFAEKWGVKDRTIYKWESGQYFPKREHFQKILEEFPTNRDVMIALYLDSDNGNRNTDKIRNDVIYELWKKADDLLSAYLASVEDGKNVKARFKDEKFFYSRSQHIIVVEFLSKIKEYARVNKLLITIKGAYNALFLTFLFGASEFSPTETFHICPTCGAEKHSNNGLTNVDQPVLCNVCSTRMTNIHQYSMLPCDEIAASSFYAPREAEIELPPSMYRSVCDIAASFFSPVFRIKKKVCRENGEEYISIGLDSKDSILYETIDEVPEIAPDEEGDFNGLPTIIIRPVELNETISEKLRTQNPTLSQLFSEKNINALSASIRTELPDFLREDVASVCSIDQMINILNVLESQKNKKDKSLSYVFIKRLKTDTKIANWTNLPFTIEAFELWASDDKKLNPKRWDSEDYPIFYSRRRIKEFYLPNVPKSICWLERHSDSYSKGLYTDVLYRLLFKTFFNI